MFASAAEIDISLLRLMNLGNWQTVVHLIHIPGRISVL